jgi:hypothetical protein
MTKHPPNGSFTTSSMASDVKLFAVTRTAQANEDFSAEIADYLSACLELTSKAETIPPEVMLVADLASAELNAEARVSKAFIDTTRDVSHSAAQEQRAFQYEHGVARLAISANAPLASVKISAMTFIEGVIHSTFLYEAGFSAGVAPAVMSGFMLAGTTTLLSAGLGGGLFGRFWNYGLRAPLETPEMRKARRMGRIGALLTGTAIAGVLGISAIVRTTGEPENLQFSVEVLKDVFSSMPSVMLILTGTAFAILSWRTALSAFNDPYPGLTQASQATLKAAHDTEITTRQAHEALANIQDNAMADLADCADAVSDVRRDVDEAVETLNAEYHRLLGLIAEREAVIREEAASLLQAQTFIMQTASDFDVADISLEDLRARLTMPARPVFEDLHAFRKDHKIAVNDVAAAYISALDHLENVDPAASHSSSPIA